MSDELGECELVVHYLSQHGSSFQSAIFTFFLHYASNPTQVIFSPSTLAGPVQEPASHQEQEGEDISRALNLEEVVQESSSEWQSIGNVFR